MGESLIIFLFLKEGKKLDLEKPIWDFPGVQWLRFHDSNAGGLGSIPGQGTRSHMRQLKRCAEREREKEKKPISTHTHKSF